LTILKNTSQQRTLGRLNIAKGGDLLYRWGNPYQYGAGARNDNTLFQQHCAM